MMEATRQGPDVTTGHRYAGRRSPEGYGICEDCGARENTPEAARGCWDGRCPFCSVSFNGPLVIDAVLHIGGNHRDELRKWLHAERRKRR